MKSGTQADCANGSFELSYLELSAKLKTSTTKITRGWRASLVFYDNSLCVCVEDSPAPLIPGSPNSPYRWSKAGRINSPQVSYVLLCIYVHFLRLQQQSFFLLCSSSTSEKTNQGCFAASSIFCLREAMRRMMESSKRERKEKKKTNRDSRCRKVARVAHLSRCVCVWPYKSVCVCEGGGYPLIL